MERRPDVDALFQIRTAVRHRHGITPGIERTALPTIIGEEETHLLGELAKEQEVLSTSSEGGSKLILPGDSKLLKMSTEIHNIANRWVSHASLAAAYLSLEFHTQLLVKAKEYADFGNIPYFVIAHDVAHGSSILLASVHFGTDGVALGHDRLMHIMLRGGGQAGMNRQSAEFRMMDQEQAVKERLLRDDPTGMKLVDEAVKFASGQRSEIARRPSRAPILNERYIALGAESAARMYRAAYPVAELVPPPSAH